MAAHANGCARNLDSAVSRSAAKVLSKDLACKATKSEASQGERGYSRPMPLVIEDLSSVRRIGFRIAEALEDFILIPNPEFSDMKGSRLPVRTN
jgi:hypothetical protein